MILYAVIMLLVAILFGILAASISKGNIQLIHDHHRTKVTDPKAYGKAFGKGMWGMAGTMAVSGIVSLLGSSGAIMWIAVAVLAVGFLLSLMQLVKVQKIYNGGIF